MATLCYPKGHTLQVELSSGHSRRGCGKFVAVPDLPALDIHPVERVGELTPIDFGSRFELADRPCVLVGGARGWRATQCWSAAYLKEKIGNIEVKYKVSTSHAHPDFHQPTLDKMFSLGKGSFGTFLDEITKGPAGERARRQARVSWRGDEWSRLSLRPSRTHLA